MKLTNVRRTLNLIGYFFFAYPVRSSLMVFSMLAAALAEGLGIAAILPLISLVIGPSANQGALGQYVEEIFTIVGFELSIGSLLTAIVVLMTLKALLVLVAMAQVGFTAAHVTMDLRLKVLRALMDARWQHFVDQRAGHLASAVGGEPSRAASAYLAACRILVGGVQVAIYTALSFVISWQVTIAALAVGGLSIVLLNRFVHISGRAGHDQTRIQRVFMTRLLEGLNGMKPLKAMACEGRLTPLIEADVRSLNKAQQTTILSKECLSQFQEPIRTLALAIGLFFLLQVWDKPLESLFVLALLFSRTVQRIGNLQSYYQVVVRDQPAFLFLRSTIRRAENAREVNVSGQRPHFNDEITLRSVHFSYGRKQVLRGASLTIPAGQFVAIIGPSGVGKTTVADLVIGLIRPQAGEVWIDDLPMSEIDTKKWRGMIGYVPQDTFLFHDTILMNVTLGDDGLNREQVETALRRADAWEFVDALPRGLDTVVGEKGARLSGGQRQRIAIARALVRDPALLVLDEATTALDPVTEAEICATLRHLAGKVTILAISHQPALKAVANIVYCLQNGTVCRERDSQQPSRQFADRR